MPGLCPAHSWRSPAECNRRRGHSSDARGPSAIQVHRRPALGYYVMSAVGKPVSIATLHLGHGIVTTVSGTWPVVSCRNWPRVVLFSVGGFSLLPERMRENPFRTTQRNKALHWDCTGTQIAQGWARVCNSQQRESYTQNTTVLPTPHDQSL